MKRIIKSTDILKFAIVLIVILNLPLALEVGYRLYYKNRISHNVYFSETDVSGFNKNNFVDLINNKTKNFKTLTVYVESLPYEINLSEINYSVDGEQSWKNAALLKKYSSPGSGFISFTNYFKKVDAQPALTYTQQLLNNEVDKIISLVSTPAVFENLSLEDDQIVDIPGTDGYELDRVLLRQGVHNSLLKFSLKTPNLNLKHISANINSTEKSRLIFQANSLINKKMTIELNGVQSEINDQELISTLNDSPSVTRENVERIAQRITKTYDRETKNSVFVFSSGKVTEFAPSEEGVAVDKTLLINKIIEKRNLLANSNKLEISLDLPYTKTNPEITTGDINNLGIKEKIGHGESTFRGSASTRIHNIKLASSEFDGFLIAPGETFSFNKILGDVSKVTGYQQAYIIKDGQTVLGDGGGVCQVSTTMFRAALDAGLPIIERRSHSYRVSYYEQNSPPGLDATVFDPTTDMKFKNDTENYILIQAIFNSANSKLTFDFYGTSDGRVTTITKPVIKDVTPPPEDAYLDDPTLKTGVVKQIDYKAWGAKVYFNYKVERGGSVIFEKIFYSNYLPWQAKFLRGTAPA